MINKLILTFGLLLVISADAQTTTIASDHHFDSEYKKWVQSKPYYDWKVFIVANNAYLSSIKQVDYYLDPTFRNSTRHITSKKGNKNFTLCCNGWGGFTIRIKIIFNDPNKADSMNYIPLT